MIGTACLWTKRVRSGHVRARPCPNSSRRVKPPDTQNFRIGKTQHTNICVRNVNSRCSAIAPRTGIISVTKLSFAMKSARNTTLWKLATEHWSPHRPSFASKSHISENLDSVYHTWYTLGMPHHVRFICKTCKRPITGCLPSCPEPVHRTEEVESCAVCKQPKAEKE
jgi:hypothetical protein